MSKENLKLWDSVQGTDPGATKTMTISGRKVTSIDAYTQLKNATKQFGSYGEWGLKEIELSYRTIGDTVLCTLKGWFHYKEYGFPVINSIKVSYVTKNGQGYLKIDEEYAKKLETNTITKALSRLGFNADVFMGKFDDDRYVQSLKEEKVKKALYDKPYIEWTSADLSGEIKAILSNKGVYSDLGVLIREKHKSKMVSDSRMIKFIEMVSDLKDVDLVKKEIESWD